VIDRLNGLSVLGICLTDWSVRALPLTLDRCNDRPPLWRPGIFSRGFLNIELTEEPRRTKRYRNGGSQGFLLVGFSPVYATHDFTGPSGGLFQFNIFDRIFDTYRKLVGSGRGKSVPKSPGQRKCQFSACGKCFFPSQHASCNE
jgi:hypothetical protein